MKNIAKGLIAGIVIGFVAGNYFPSSPYSKYDIQMQTVAVSTRLIYGVCPNEIGVSAMRDLYLKTITNVTEKEYILDNFNSTFDAQCRNINIVNNP